MEYIEEEFIDCHIIRLTHEEATQLFDDMPKGYRSGFLVPYKVYMLLKSDVREWLESNAMSDQDPKYALYSIRLNDMGFFQFRFYRKHLAMQFKLRWG